MAYKDREKQRKKKREWARKHRGSTKGSTGSTEASTDSTKESTSLSNLDKEIEPFVEPFSIESLSKDIEYLKGEARTFREAFSTLNSLTKRLDALEKELAAHKEAIKNLEDSGGSQAIERPYLKSRPGAKKSGIGDSGKKTEDRDDDKGDAHWRTSLCPKHGRQPILGKWACCGE